MPQDTILAHLGSASPTQAHTSRPCKQLNHPPLDSSIQPGGKLHKGIVVRSVLIAVAVAICALGSRGPWSFMWICIMLAVILRLFRSVGILKGNGC